MRTTSFTLLALAALIVRPTLAVGRDNLPVLVLIGVLDAAGNALFALATTESLLSVAAVLAQLYPVVTVLLARVGARRADLASSAGRRRERVCRHRAHHGGLIGPSQDYPDGQER